MDREITRAQDVTIGSMKGSVMKTIWFCVLSCLLSIVAYIGFPDTPSAAEQPKSETPVEPFIAAAPPPVHTPETIALDASSGRPAPDPTDNDNNLAASLSAYVFLHKTWNEGLSAPATAELNVPWHWLRSYAITQRPTENR